MSLLLWYAVVMAALLGALALVVVAQWCVRSARRLVGATPGTQERVGPAVPVPAGR